jgi:hypothetical protein
MGHAETEVGDYYSKLKDDVSFRQEWAERVGLGFELVHKTDEKSRKPMRGRILELVGASGFEPPRTREAENLKPWRCRTCALVALQNLPLVGPHGTQNRDQDFTRWAKTEARRRIPLGWSLR